MAVSILKKLLPAWLALGFSLLPAHGQRQLETLGRGVIALRSSSTQVHVSWRLLGNEPADRAFNLYRSTNGGAPVKLNATPLTRTTDFLDSPGSTVLAGANSYFVRPLLDGVEGSASTAFTLPANAPVRQYLAIPKSPVGADHYGLGQAYPADVDGDGEFELVCRLDYLGSGTAPLGRFAFDCYKLDGTRLWRVLAGPDLLASNDGDGYLNAADYDGDGKAEVAIRTTAGTVFGNGATLTDTGSREFLSIVNGMTGVEMARVPFKPALGPDYHTYWGANMRPFYLYMATAFLDGVRPSLVTCRGIGGDRLHVHAWDFRNGALTERWSWIANSTEYMATGHNLLVYDLDNDQKDEIVFIGGALDDDGRFLYSTGLGHGDHFRFADLDPDRPGFECYAIQQDAALGALIYDGSTGRSIRKWYLDTPGDPSRADAGDVDPDFRGAEVWSVMPNIWSAKGELIGDKSIFPARGIWWDRDLQREIFSGAGSGQMAPVINKINADHNEARLYSIYNEGVTQGFGGFPPFSGDLLGDWREEVVLDSSDRTQIRVYATRIPAENRFYTLMHNPAYRAGATCKGRTGAMSPDYYLGGGMEAVPPPPIVESDLVWQGGLASNAWDVNTTSNWKKNTATLSYLQGRSVLFDLTGNHAAPVRLATTLAPAAVTVHSPVPYTFGGTGALSGTMPLVKAGAGSLTVNGIHPFSGPTTVWDGALIVNGRLAQSPVTVRGGTWGGALAGGLTGGRIGGSGEFGNGVILDYGAAITPGNGMGAAGTLTIAGTLTQRDGAVNAFDLSDDPSGTSLANDRIRITGHLQLSGISTILIKPLDGTLAPGTYTLVTYSGSLTGGLANLRLAGPPGVPATLANPPGAITLVVPNLRAPSSLTWTGGANGAWDLAQSANWLRAGNPEVFVPGDAVAFDDSGAASPAVQLSDSVSPASITVDSSSHYTFAGSGRIIGGGGLTKRGSGTLTLLTDNGFTGTTRIEGGVLEIDTLAEAGQASPIGAADASPDKLVLDSCTLRLLDQGGGFTDRGATLGAGGATVEVVGTSGGMTLGGPVTGGGRLTKTGPGTLQFTRANAYGGGTVIAGGTISLGTATANANGLGGGPVTFQNGTLTMANIESSANASWPMIVPAGFSGRLNADGRCSLRGTLTGSGDFTVLGPYVRTDFHGDWSQFTGTLRMRGDIRVANTFGYGGAAVNLDDATLYAIHTVPAAGIRLDLGELSGNAAARLRGAATAIHVLTWRVGGRNTDATFAGNIGEQSAGSVTAIQKVGTGTWTLGGTNTHRGTTTVSAGKLVLTGSITASNVTVQSSAILENRGTITGDVTVGTGGTLAPAGAIVGNLTNHGTVRVTGSDTLSVSGTFINYGTLDLGTWGGTLPANFINQGTILSAPLPAVAITSPAADPVSIGGISSRLELTGTVAGANAHAWSMVSGPGDVSFTDATALRTSAGFSAPGVYVLELSATNQSGTATARRGVLVGAVAPLAFREGENGYGHTGAMIREDTPSWNSGARDQFLVGRTNSRLRAVLAFPLPAGLPANAVASVSLDLWTAAAGSVGDLQLHRLLALPTEGSGNSSTDATNGAGTGVTWIRRTDAAANLNWTSAGADFDAPGLATIPGFTAAAGNQRHSFASTAGFVAAVQAALQAGQPLGLLIQSPATTTNNQFIRFASDDFATPGQRPLLTLQLAGTPLPAANPGTAPGAVAGVAAALSGSVAAGSVGTPLVSWTLVAGPGGASFENPVQASTRVTFSRPGNHLLRLTATDANGATSADLAVTVAANPALRPEVVITSPSIDAATLQDANTTLHLAAAIDSALPATIAWTKVSGPGEISFGAATSPGTTASFTAPGSYLIECAATNLNGSGSARRSVLIGHGQITRRQGEDGYSHVAAMIRGDTPSWNSGARDQMLVGKLSGGQGLRGVLSFGLGDLPPNSTVSRATLDLWTSGERAPGTVDELELRPLLGAVVEGSGTSSSNSSDGAGSGLTWNSRNGGAAPENLWSTPGGDFGGGVLSTMPGFDATQTLQRRTFPHSEAFAHAARTAALAGEELRLIIVSPATALGPSNRYARFASDDAAAIGTRPLLTLQFTGPPLPGIHTGPALAANSGQPLEINAGVTNADSTSWSQLAGPAPAVFAAAHQAATSATFDTPGDYLLRLSATNPTGTASADLPVTVAPNPSRFPDWQTIHWPGVDDPAIVGPNADPDGDGLANLLEFALLLDPATPAAWSGKLELSGNLLAFTYTRARHATGLSYHVEWSDSLAPGSWSGQDVQQTVVPPDSDPDRQTIQASAPAGGGTRRFLRLRVTQP